MLSKYIATASLCAGIIVYAGSSTSLAAAQSYTLDPAHTTVAFLVDHVGFAKTLGLFTEVSGSLSFDQETSTVTDIAISVATGSVNTAHEARDKHVRNKDFLNVERFPEMTFNAASATIDSNGAGEIEGNLTLLGSTQPLTLSVTLNKAERYPFGHKRFTLGVSASGELNRSDYGMNYGVANSLVGDTVTLIIETEAIQVK
ncbi:MAG: YceI family protein [Granulosicoccus sp.]